MHGLSEEEGEGLNLKRIVLTGGGTAGHVTPNLALIPTLLGKGFDVHYIGSYTGIEKDLIAHVEGVTYHAVSTGKFRRYIDMKNISDPLRVLKGTAQATALLRKLKPDIVFSKGGYVSVPVVYGALFTGVPVLLHESDMSIGLANRLSALVAKKTLCTFPEAAKAAGAKGVYVGTPLRTELFSGDKARGLERFGFSGSRPVLMITGGSTGAQSINRAVREALPQLSKVFDVLHLCGAGNMADILGGTPHYCQIEYLVDGMPDAYAAADIIISRAGSNTVCELLALNKPALLIPYPSTVSRGDQILNAQSVEKRHLAHVLMQEDMTTDMLARCVFKLYKERGELIENLEKEKAQDGVKHVMAYIDQYVS